MPESILNLLLSGLMGLMGGLITIHINGVVSLLLKQDELEFKDKLERRAKREELLLHHELEMALRGTDAELAELKTVTQKLADEMLS